MKKIFILSLLFCSFYYLGTCQNYKNEIGIGIFKFRHLAPNENAPLIPFVRTKSIDTKNNRKGKTIAFPDIYFTRSLNKTFKLRASFFAYKFQASNSIWEPPFHEQYYKRSKIGVGIGVQQNFFYTKNWTPYLGFDLLGIYDSIQHESHPSLWPSFGDTPEKSRKNYLDARLSFGFIRYLNKRYSVSIESAFMVREELAFPISRLSVNYHF